MLHRFFFKPASGTCTWKTNFIFTSTGKWLEVTIMQNKKVSVFLMNQVFLWFLPQPIVVKQFLICVSSADEKTIFFSKKLSKPGLRVWVKHNCIFSSAGDSGKNLKQTLWQGLSMKKIMMHSLLIIYMNTIITSHFAVLFWNNNILQKPLHMLMLQI